MTWMHLSTRKQAEEALVKASALQNAIFNSANFSSIATDAKGVIQIFNVGAERMLGYVAADVMNKVTPADISDPHEVIARAKALSAELGTPITPGFEALVFKASRGIEDIYELTYIRKDGSRFPAVVSVTALRDAQNAIIGYLLIGTDNTARKRAESLLKESEVRYHSVVSALSEGVVLHARNGTITAWNHAAEHIFGLSGEQIQGRTTLDPRWQTIHEDGTSFPGETHPSQEVLRTGVPQSNVIMGICKPDGTLTWISINAVPIFDSGDPSPTAVVDSFSDITERKRVSVELEKHRNHLEELVVSRTLELAKAKDAAEDATLAKSEFLAHMSHEIRTPMNAIVGAARLMECESLTPRQLGYARIMRHSSRSLLALIHNILDLSKIEAGSIELETETFDLAQIVDGLAGVAAASAQGKDIEFNFDLAPDLPARLMGDAYRLEQVLNNLLTNAIKFTTQGEITLRVQKVSDDAGNVQLFFALSDTGIGISSEKLGTIFEPFVQAERTITRTHGGTGLGLAISRRLVELMGGAIEVESAPGQGSRFAFMATFQLPTAAEGASTQAGLAGQRIECDDFPLSTSPLAGRRVLMVEDNQFNRVVLEGMLQHFGIEVDAAIDGYDGVERFKTGCPYDAILMDLHLPGLDGFDCARAIRALPEGAQVPIIAFTANVLSTTGGKCRAAGMNDYLTKPVEPEILLRTLMHWILGKGSSAPVKVAPVAEDPADRLPDELPGIDRAKALVFSSSARALVKLLNHMLSHCGDDPVKLSQHIIEGDTNAAARITHDLMAVASMVGASTLFDAARQLNHELRAGSPGSTLAQEAIDSLVTEFSRLNEAREILRPWLD